MVNVRRELWIDECDLELLDSLNRKPVSVLRRKRISSSELDEYFEKC